MESGKDNGYLSPAKQEDKYNTSMTRCPSAMPKKLFLRKIVQS